MNHVVLSLVTYKNHAVTDTCLSSLEKMQVPEHTSLSIIVINNDSAKEYDYAWKGRGEFHIENRKENLGFAGGHNIGIRFALEVNADYVLILNNDTLVEKELLQALLTAAADRTDAGVFGAKIYFAKGHEFHHERYKKDELGKVFWYAGGKIDWQNMILSHRGVDEVDHGQYDERGETDFVSGCCMFIRMDAVKKVGMFDERYFLYLEDSDLNERIKRAGYKCVYVPEAVLWHENAGSAGGSGSELQDYFMTRNRLLFGYTFAPLRTKIALFRESLTFLRSGRPWQKIGVSDYYKRRFGKGSYRV